MVRVRPESDRINCRTSDRSEGTAKARRSVQAARLASRRIRPAADLFARRGRLEARRATPTLMCSACRRALVRQAGRARAARRRSRSAGRRVSPLPRSNGYISRETGGICALLSGGMGTSPGQHLPQPSSFSTGGTGECGRFQQIAAAVRHAAVPGVPRFSASIHPG